MFNNRNGCFNRQGNNGFDNGCCNCQQSNGCYIPHSSVQQLILTLNGEDLAYTVVGRATGTSQIVGMALVETNSANSVLTVRNPEGTATALTITPLAGGTRPVSAHLVIMQIA